MEGRSWRHPIIAFSFGESNLEQVRIGVADKGEAQQVGDVSGTMSCRKLLIQETEGSLPRCRCQRIQKISYSEGLVFNLFG